MIITLSCVIFLSVFSWNIKSYSYEEKVKISRRNHLWGDGDNELRLVDHTKNLVEDKMITVENNKEKCLVLDDSFMVMAMRTPKVC